MPTLVRTPLLAVSLVIAGMIAAESRSEAQSPTYVGTFAMTNGATVQCLTETGTNKASMTKPWAAIPAQEWAFLRLSNGFYAIFNLQSGAFLRDQGATVADMTLDAAWTGDLSQMWYLYPLGGNFYAIVNVDSGYMLTDQDTATVSGEYVLDRQWKNNLNQWWYLYFLYK